MAEQNYVSLLNELVMKTSGDCINYRIVSSGGPPHRPWFQMAVQIGEQEWIGDKIEGKSILSKRDVAEKAYNHLLDMNKSELIDLNTLPSNFSYEINDLKEPEYLYEESNEMWTPLSDSKSADSKEGVKNIIKESAMAELSYNNLSSKILADLNYLTQIVSRIGNRLIILEGKVDQLLTKK